MAAVGPAERADDFPGDLSPADRHRADLARVFARRPEHVLADDPFTRPSARDGAAGARVTARGTAAARRNTA